jgi:hypothetical protein
MSEERCMCVCHVGIDGPFQAHACDCPDCPGRIGIAHHAFRSQVERLWVVRHTVNPRFGDNDASSEQERTR